MAFEVCFENKRLPVGGGRGEAPTFKKTFGRGGGGGGGGMGFAKKIKKGGTTPFVTRAGNTTNGSLKERGGGGKKELPHPGPWAGGHNISMGTEPLRLVRRIRGMGAGQFGCLSWGFLLGATGTPGEKVGRGPLRRRMEPDPGGALKLGGGGGGGASSPKKRKIGTRGGPPSWRTCPGGRPQGGRGGGHPGGKNVSRSRRAWPGNKIFHLFPRGGPGNLKAPVCAVSIFSGGNHEGGKGGGGGLEGMSSRATRGANHEFQKKNSVSNKAGEKKQKTPFF